MKITSLIFAVILMSLVMASFGIVTSNLSTNYNVAWDNTTMDLFNQLNETQTQADELQDKINAQNTDTGVIDLLGDFINKAVDSLKLTYRSMGASMTMMEESINVLGFPIQFKTAIITMIIIFVVLGVIISMMVKTPL